MNDSGDTPLPFTQLQIEAWKAYEKVRSSAKYNMFDHRARWLTGLSEEAYDFVQANFARLKEAAQVKA
jgi:hypothetical protein